MHGAIPAALPHLEAQQRGDVSRALEEDIPEALAFIETSAARMDSLIQAVLSLSRLGRSELHMERVEMETLVQEIVKTLRHQLTQHPARVRIEPLPTVCADRTAMEQIMGNLLTNAVAYLDPSRPGEIVVTAEQDAEVTTFHVRDNGRGIAEDDISKVFELFRRAGKQDVPGEGMGLAYVQTLVRRHAGSIHCHSTLDVGSIFSFTISNHFAERDTHAA